MFSGRARRQVRADYNEPLPRAAMRILFFVLTLAAMPAAAVEAGQPAPAVTLPRLSSPQQSVSIAALKGRVVYVDFWASWCGPCRMETPELVKLNKEFRDRGVEMIGLSTEDPDASAESVSDFMREYNVDYQIGWATREVALGLMQGRTNIPQSFIIARDGRIIKRFIGFSPASTPVQLRQALEQALVEKS